MISTLRASLILPIEGEPIENGEIVIEGGAIAAVRSQAGPGDNVCDFGEAILLPGFVNVHTHLELGALRGMVEDLPFFPWIFELTRIKERPTLEEWLDSARLGLAEAVAGGITTFADCACMTVMAQAASESRMRGVVFQELFGIEQTADADAILDEVEAKLTAQAKYASDRLQLHVSPHATYTVQSRVLDEVARRSGRNAWNLAIHAAESPAEMEFFRTGDGPFGERFAARGIEWAFRGFTPISHLDRCGVLRERTQLVHCVHVVDDDIRMIRERGCSVAHCPKSNAKLAAGIAPVGAIMDAGIPIGLGTDSVVSNNRLDMFEEMRQAVFMQRARDREIGRLNCREALRLATLGGAESLWMADEIGSLTVGKQADICAVSLDSINLTPYNDPYAALVYAASAADVVFTMVGGETLYHDGRWEVVDVRSLRTRALRTAKRLASVSRNVGIQGSH